MQLHFPGVLAAEIYTYGAWIRFGGVRGPGLVITMRPLRSTRIHGARMGRIWFRRLARQSE